jgi:hypothetical protein
MKCEAWSSENNSISERLKAGIQNIGSHALDAANVIRSTPRAARYAGAVLITICTLGFNVDSSRDVLGDILQRFYKDPAAVVNDGSCYREGDNVGPTNALGECPK